MSDWTRLLKDKVVLVTGAGGAIGSAIARTCILHGARVILADANKESLETIRTKLIDEDQTNPEQFMIAELDVTDEEAIVQVVKSIVDRWNTIDVLVNK